MNINWKITGGKTLSQDRFEFSTKIKENYNVLLTIRC